MAKQNKEYVYVDCYQCDENGKSSPWKRKHLDDVPKWQHEEAKDFNCFATVQKYANEKKTEGEDFLAPLYFDLDYSENPAVAQEEAIKLVEFFTGELDIQEQDLHIYFSGSKGFHILVDERALGVEPRKDLQRVYKHIAGYLRYRLGEVQEQEDENGRPVEYTEPLKAVDLVVYTVKRMLRLPYSRHQKTGLYKIELTLQQLKELTLDEIKERARTGQPIQREEKTVRKRPKAGIFYADKLHEYEEAAATVSDKRNKTEYVFVKDKPPVCVEDILNNGWKKDGDRNNATVQLCCYFKAAGYKKEEATSILEDWVVKFTSADSRYSIQQRKANTRNVSGNAPKGKRLSDYAQGAESLKDVFNNEDIRRFDFAIFMRSTDVDPEKYNRSLPSFPRTMSDDALKNNVLFAWSRTPEQVVFLPDTVDAILETATKLSKVYGNATDIPLVSPSDQRNKVARLAVALASLTHSVDESGERITVYPAHVNFIYDYLVQLYNAPGCGLNYYARLAVSEEIVGDKFDKITNELRKLDGNTWY